MDRSRIDGGARAAKRVLSFAPILLSSLLAACQGSHPTLVECGSDGDCPEGERCNQEHACVTVLTGAEGGQDLLSWDEGGWISGGENSFGIEGALYVFDDCGDVRADVAAGRFVCPDVPPTPDCCTTWDATLVGPTPDLLPGVSVAPGVPRVSSGRFCVKGATTRVLTGPDGMPSYSPQWGAGAALNLNDWEPFDASQPFPGGPIVGFSVDLEGTPTAERGIDVGVAVASSYQKYFKELPVPSTGAIVLFSQLEQGEWVTPSVPLDPTQLTEISFGMASTVDGVEPFDFCVTNVRVLQ